MAPSEKQPFYDPVPPTYDEALAGSSSRYMWEAPRSSVDRRDGTETEQQSLLNRSNGAPGSSRRPHGYQPPTVESDDSDIESLLETDSDDDDDEAAQVRREMQEMDVEEPNHSRGLSWGKRIGFALPNWKWSWRPRLPRIPLPRLRIQLPSQPPENEGGDTENDETTRSEPRWRWNLPQVNGMLAIIIFARMLAVFIILGFVYLIFASDFFNSWGGRMGTGFRFNAEDLRVYLQQQCGNNIGDLDKTIRHYTKYAHIAGTEGDYATAMDMESMFGRLGLDEVRLDEYVAYINYPIEGGREVQILDDNGKDAVWTAALEEGDRGEVSAGHQTYVFHGHSKSADVKGPLIYANYGSRDDFKKLKDMGVKAKGAIALVRTYGTQTDIALKVKAAELAGFEGCLIYSDPADDGAAKGKVAPDGPYMPPDGVQRGSVSQSSFVMGDVLTPGWGSLAGKPRMKVAEASGLPGIPSLPLSWRDAKVLIERLKGHGEKVPKDWRGGDSNLEWWTGDDKSPIVRLRNEQDTNEQQKVWNVYGKITGMEQTAKSIIIGNHRDSFAFGATDPHAGTAIMLEMGRIFSELIMKGWRPLRTIEFMSWDGKAYNSIGSTEYVENHVDMLREDAYAYINLDTAVSGDQFYASGSPLLEKTLYHAMNRVAHPEKNGTLMEDWNENGSKYEGPAGGGDHTPFQAFAGTSSIDLGFRGGMFPRDSSFDDPTLYTKVMDFIAEPDELTDRHFEYLVAVSEVVGLLILDLADRAIVPMDIVSYSNKLTAWVGDLEKWAKDNVDKGVKLDFKELKDAVHDVQTNATTFAAWEDQWDAAIMQNGGWEGNDLGVGRIRFNEIIANFDAALLDLEMGGGIPNRKQFKHTVFAPKRWSTYEVSYFPAIRDCIEDKDWEEAKRFIRKTAAIFRTAASTLYMGNDGEEGDGKNDGKDD